MVRRQFWTWALLLTATASATQAGAGTITTSSPSGYVPTMTGNVETDFPSGTAGVITLINPRYPTTNPEAFIAANKLSPGWSIKDIRLYYDKASDQMHVGINTFGIAGDADGNGNPGTVSAAAAAAGKIDVPNLGGRESITVGFDMTRTGTPTILAGIPGNKATAGTGVDGFVVSAFKNSGLGLANSFGSPLSQFDGGLAFDPSAEHPDFEFMIKNFSKLPGYDPINGFGLVAFAGTPDDGFEEEGVLFPQVAAGKIPEPATVLGWTMLGAVGLAWRRRQVARRVG